MIGHLTRRAAERSHHRVCRPPHVSYDHTQDVCEHSTCAPYARLEPADTFKPAFDGCGLKTAGICTIRHSRVHVRLCAGCDRHAGAPGSDPTRWGPRAAGLLSPLVEPLASIRSRSPQTPGDLRKFWPAPPPQGADPRTWAYAVLGRARRRTPSGAVSGRDVGGTMPARRARRWDVLGRSGGPLRWRAPPL